MNYLLTRIARDGSTIGTSNEWTSVHSNLNDAMDKIHSTDNWCARIQFCAEGWTKTCNGRKPNGKVSTIYEYNGED